MRVRSQDAIKYVPKRSPRRLYANMYEYNKIMSSSRWHMCLIYIYIIFDVQYTYVMRTLSLFLFKWATKTWRCNWEPPQGITIIAPSRQHAMLVWWILCWFLMRCSCLGCLRLCLVANTLTTQSEHLGFAHMQCSNYSCERIYSVFVADVRCE